MSTIRVRGLVGIHRWQRLARGGLAGLVTVLAVAGCSIGQTAPAASAPAAPAASAPAAPPVAAPPAAASSGAADAAPPGAPEVNPSGDIPDNQVYVPFTAPEGLFAVSVPQGWSRSSQGNAVVFTDKLNNARFETVPRAQAPDIAAATAQEVPAIQASTPGYQPGQVSMVSRAAGPAVLVTYQASSAPNPVTGKAVTDTVERYEFWKSGQEAVVTLSGPPGADNVDPYRMITGSFRWLR